VSIVLKTDPQDLNSSVQGYCDLLGMLRDKVLFGVAVTIYPAIGVDGLPAKYTQNLVGFNLARYSTADILEHLGPVIADRMRAELESALARNLTYFGSVDVSGFKLLEPSLIPYRHMSPKSFLLKSLFRYVFLQEWDRDTERYYHVELAVARENARSWIEEMGHWLDPGDVVIALDRELFPLICNLAQFVEIDLGLKDPGPTDVMAYGTSVPVVFFTTYARIFRKLTSEAV